MQKLLFFLNFKIKNGLVFENRLVLLQKKAPTTVKAVGA